MKTRSFIGRFVVAVLNIFHCQLQRQSPTVVVVIGLGSETIRVSIIQSAQTKANDDANAKI